MNNIKDAHELQKEIPWAGQEKAGRERSTVDPLAPQEKSGLPRKSPLQSKLQNLDMQVRGCQKATQRVCKMKQIACVHDHSDIDQSYKYEPVNK